MTADNLSVLLEATRSVVDRILAFGGRIGLEKCHFLVSTFQWCGVQVDLATSQWRVDPARTSALTETPLPKDRAALEHILGIIRYYMHGITDQMAQRERIAVLALLDKPGVHLANVWSDEHTTAMRDAIKAIVEGDWILVFDPTQPVYITTDAAGALGYSIVASQSDMKTGVMRPISFYSKGWVGVQLTNQLLWTAQVKECYAQRQAVC